MTLPKYRKKAIAYFSAVLTVYLAILGFLLFFTPGLELLEKETTRTTEMFVLNTSIHLIRDVRVSTMDGKQLLALEKLKPAEKVQVPLAEVSDESVINAVAPFHASTSKKVSLKKPKGAKIGYETSYQNIALVGEKFTLFLDVCNTGDIDLEEVSIREKHAAEYFAEESMAKKTRMRMGQCEKIEFVFTPKKMGETEIYFNIEALDYKEEFKRKIKTVEI